MIGFQLRRVLMLGIKSLWMHRLRSVLTVLGMVFGVCSVIAMLAIGEGAGYEAQEQIKQLGSTNIIIRAVKPPDDPASDSSTSRVAEYGLTYADAERIALTIPSVQVTVPVREIRKDVWHLAVHAEATIMGTVPWFPEIMKRKVGYGRFLSSSDTHYAQNVCVIEPELAATLFPFDDALGNVVKIGLDYYRVVGVMSSATGRKASNGNGAASGSHNGLYVPLTTVRARFGEMLVRSSSGSTEMEMVELHEIGVRVKDIDDVIPTADVLRQILRRFHKKQDFEVQVPLEQLNIAKEIQRTSNIVLGSIAAISLIVGGIGIMNIMLASVTERTREIGIRRALGAKRRHIIAQFLTETVMLSGFGGLLGMALGVVIPTFVEHFAKMKTIVTLWSLAAAFLISAAVGIIFGIYPAYRAANMDPIQALRHE